LAVILSFDQASQITGYFVCKDGEYFAHGMIDLHTDKNAEHRMRVMQSRIFELIDRYMPSAVIVEETILQRSPATLRMLSQLQGAIMGYCLANDIPVHILYPTQWRGLLRIKQGSRVKREALKQQAIDYVKQKYNIIVSSDEADAICIGLAYLKSQEVSNEQ